VRLDNRVVSFVLRSRAHPLLSRYALLLRYRGRRTGHVYAIPVQYVERDSELVLFAMNAASKQWWRNLHGAEVDVLLRGAWRHASSQVVRGDTELARSYRERFRSAARQIKREPNPVFVVLTLLDDQ